MKQVILFIGVISTLFFASCSKKNYCSSYYLASKHYASTNKDQAKRDLLKGFPNWGVRKVPAKGFEYNTGSSFKWAYVLYYFDKTDETSNLGVYYQSDALYLKDLIWLLEKNNYRGPSENEFDWEIPFYCSIYYHSRHNSDKTYNKDTISLCPPNLWQESDKIFARKLFELDESKTRLIKLFEYKDFNPDPIFLNSYAIDLKNQSEFEYWVKELKQQEKKEIASNKFESHFFEYTDTTHISTKTTGWAYFGKKEEVEFSPNFYFKGGFWRDFSHVRKRFRIKLREGDGTTGGPQKSIIKRYFLHPFKGDAKNQKLVPIYDLAVYDTITAISGKEKLIKCAANDYYYTLLNYKIFKDAHDISQVWVQLDLTNQLEEEKQAAETYQRSLENAHNYCTKCHKTTNNEKTCKKCIQKENKQAQNCQCYTKG